MKNLILIFLIAVIGAGCAQDKVRSFEDYEENSDLYHFECGISLWEGQIGEGDVNGYGGFAAYAKSTNLTLHINHLYISPSNGEPIFSCTNQVIPFEYSSYDIKREGKAYRYSAHHHFEKKDIPFRVYEIDCDLTVIDENQAVVKPLKMNGAIETKVIKQNSFINQF